MVVSMRGAPRRPALEEEDTMTIRDERSLRIARRTRTRTAGRRRLPQLRAPAGGSAFAGDLLPRALRMVLAVGRFGLIWIGGYLGVAVIIALAGAVAN
jgi:hypothetical protein